MLRLEALLDLRTWEPSEPAAPQCLRSLGFMLTKALSPLPHRIPPNSTPPHPTQAQLVCHELKLCLLLIVEIVGLRCLQLPSLCKQGRAVTHPGGQTDNTFLPLIELKSFLHTANMLQGNMQLTMKSLH